MQFLDKTVPNKCLKNQYCGTCKQNSYLLLDDWFMQAKIYFPCNVNACKLYLLENNRIGVVNFQCHNYLAK